MLRPSATDISYERILIRNSRSINIYLTNANKERWFSGDFDYRRPTPKVAEMQ